MQVSKSLTAICAIAVCSSFISVHAQDNPAQAAARAALMEKMGELNPPTSPPPVAAPEQPASTNVPTPPTAAAAPMAPIPVPPPIETPAPATTMPAATEPAPTPPPVVAPIMAPMTNAVVAQPPAKPVPSASMKQVGNEPGFTAIVAPPLPISMTKEERLQALNAKYVANEIPPQEYFKQREAILAEPDATSH